MTNQYSSYRILYMYRLRLFQGNVFYLNEIQNALLASWKLKKKICRTEIKTTNLKNLKSLMATWSYNVSILIMSLPIMEGQVFVLTNAWTIEQNSGFHGNINHVTKRVEWLRHTSESHQKHVTMTTSPLQINEFRCQECKRTHKNPEIPYCIYPLSYSVISCYIKVSVQCVYCIATWSCNQLYMVK